MTPELWRKIDELYHAARERGPGVLADADPEVRREVEALLAQDTARVALLDRPVGIGFSPGTMLGPYRIETPIGRGGMGEVWKARDTRLGRDVAIKVAHQNFGERFEREARAIATLNHPNICTLYDVGPNYLVMELVEGETPSGPLPSAEVLRIGRQIGDALMAAHDAGIVHRDLKPANIKVRPDGVVKVLDFGLASLVSADSTVPGEAATIATPTASGVIIGSAPWMSPEQARGRKIDKRTDIWAFGVVLYEISTGERLFTGETLSDTIVQVLTKEPDLSRLPPELKPLVNWCLEKDASKRLRDIADARPWLEIGALPMRKTEPVAELPVQSSKTGPWWQLATAAALLAAIGIGAVHFREKPAPTPEMMRFQLRLPDGVRFEPGSTLTLAPDGRHIAFPGITAEGYRIFVQDLDGGLAHALANPRISNATPPFTWSPDSDYIAYSAGGPSVNKVEVATGVVESICVKPGPAVGSAWSRDGTLIFGSTTTGLWRVPAAGGTATPLTRLDPSRRETAHELPMFLPDGKHYLFLALSGERAKSGILARSIDDAPEKPSRFVVSTDFGARFVPGADSKSGWLLYLRGGEMMAQAFDAEKLSLTGNPSVVPVKVGTAYQTALFAASASALVYRGGGASQRFQLVRVDGKTGKDLGTAGEAGAISDPRLSPDEKRVAYAKEDDSLRKDVWILDLERGSSARLTFKGMNESPVWSPDSSEVAYASREGQSSDTLWHIARRKADGSEPEEVVLKLPGESLFPDDWSRDGRFLIFDRIKGRTTLAALPLAKGAAPVQLSPTIDFSENEGRLSPDGHYLAYYSNETGRNEVYVRTFAPDSGGQPAGKWLISNVGGQHPQWTSDGKKLVWPVTGTVYASSVDTSHGFRAGVPEALYPTGGAVGAASTLTTKGQALVLKPVGMAVDEPINVLVNWMSAIKPN